MSTVRFGLIRAMVVTATVGLTGGCGASKGTAQRSTASPAAPASTSSDAELHHHGDHSGAGHRHRFDDAARWSKVFDDPARDEWQKPARVVALLAIEPGMTVADVGAGTGYFLPHLSRAVGAAGKVIAEDVEPAMVRWIDERARREKLANVQAIVGTPEDPKLPAGSLDRIVIVDTWHHVVDRTAFARKLVEALKPSDSKRDAAAVYIVDFTPESPYGPPKSMRLAAEAVARDLVAAGLIADVLPSTELPHQYVVRGRR